MRIYLVPLAFVAFAACLSAILVLPVPSERQDTVAQIDFAALHEQANAALEYLQQSRERRMALASTAAF